VAAFERFWEIKQPKMDQIFSSQSTPLERLEKYCQAIVDDQNERYCAGGKVLGCPFCSLGGELSTQDENIRKKMEQMSLRFMKYNESLVRDLAADGSIECKDPKELARELYFFVIGVMMQAKIENNPEILNRLHHGALRLLNVKPSAAVVV
jgi:TetR/AcrR family transcriptional repressor of nem operon